MLVVLAEVLLLEVDELVDADHVITLAFDFAVDVLHVVDPVAEALRDEGGEVLGEPLEVLGVALVFGIILDGLPLAGEVVELLVVRHQLVAEDALDEEVVDLVHRELQRGQFLASAVRLGEDVELHLGGLARIQVE